MFKIQIYFISLALNISGKFDAKAMYQQLVKEQKTSKKFCSENELMEFNEKRYLPEEPFVLHNYLISRYQVWSDSPYSKCGGWFRLKIYQIILEKKNLSLIGKKNNKNI